MKTTNYELSLKLHKAGFRAKFDFCYKKGKKGQGKWNYEHEIKPWPEEDDGENIGSYDLETLIEALPSIIIGYGYFSLQFESPDCKYMGYNLEDNEKAGQFFVGKAKNKSLADCAAILLLALHQKKLIEFKK